MSDKLDHEILSLVSRMIDTHSQDALLVRRIWSDRQTLVDGLKEMRDWDMTHSEALSIKRVQLLVENLLEDVYEDE